MKHTFALWGLGLCTVILAGCGASEIGDEVTSPSTSVVEKESESLEIVAEKESVSDPERGRKTDEINDLAKEFRDGSMEDVNELFSDLKTVKIIGSESTDSLLKDGNELWQYSKSGDVTVIVSEKHDAPIYVFEGNRLYDDEIEFVRVIVSEMRKRRQ